MADMSIDLLRPLGPMEHFCAVGGFYNNYNTVQAIWLKTKSAIIPDNVINAIQIISRKFVLLRCRILKRRTRLWFGLMKNFMVDFEATNNTDPKKVYEDLLSKPFDLLKGPLWKVRLILLEEQSENTGSAVLFFSVHHCITDGITNMYLCRETVRLLNQMTSEPSTLPVPVPSFSNLETSEINEHTTTGKKTDNFIPPELTDLLDMNSTFSILARWFIKSNLKTTSSISGTFYRPKGAKPTPKAVFITLSTEETSQFMRHCKQQRVTVHSCITTAASFAILRVANRHSHSKFKKATVNHGHCINMRRFFKDDQKNVLGCQISLLDLKTTASLNDANKFWDIAREFQTKLNSALEQRIPIDTLPLGYVFSLVFWMNKIRQDLGLKYKRYFNFLTTNMGDLEDLLPESSQHDEIEIVDLKRSVYCPYDGNPLLVTFHTFRNRLMLSLDYYPNKIAEDLAIAFFNALITQVKELAEKGQISQA